MRSMIWQPCPACLICAGLFVEGGSGEALAEWNAPTINESSSASEGVMYKVPGVPDSQAATPDSSAQGNFLQRLGGYYKADWTGHLPSSPAPARRMLDAPLDSPPFPSSDWGYGGSSAIGVPD